MKNTIRLAAALASAAAMSVCAQITPASTDSMRSIEAVEYTAKNQGNEAALELAEKRLKANPKNANVRFSRAKLLAQLGRTNDAKAAFEALIADHPEIPEPYNNLAAIYAAEGNLRRAEELLHQAIQANPRFQLAQSNLGDLYLALAEEAYTKAAQGKKNFGAEKRLKALARMRDAVAGKVPLECPKCEECAKPQQAAAPADGQPAAEEKKD